MRTTSMWTVRLGLATVLALTGCDGEEPMADGGPPVDGGPASDAGPIADAGPDPDGGPVDCETRCTAAGFACVRDVCIALCDFDDADEIDEALGEGVRPIEHLCRPASTRASRVEGDSLFIYELTTSSEGTTTTFEVSRFQWNFGEAPSPVTLATTTAEVEAAFPGGYLAVSPSGANVAFGYTAAGDGFPGSVFRVVTMSGESVELPANGNFDAAWVDEETLLLNGGGGAGGVDEGQGLYRITFGDPVVVDHAVEDLGTASGSVSALSSDLFLIGGSIDSPFGVACLLPVSTLAGALPLSTGGLQCRDDLPTTFTALAADAVATSNWMTGELVWTRLDLLASFEIAEERVLFTAEGFGSTNFTRALPGPSGRVLLTSGVSVLAVDVE